MRWLVALWGACSLCLACGGKAAQKAGSEPEQPAKACFALSDTLGSTELAERVAVRLGLGLQPSALELSRAGGFARAQQLVEGVEATLRAGSPPGISRQLLRGFLTQQLLPEPLEALDPAAPSDLDPAIAAAMAGELERFTIHWMLENDATLTALLADDTTQLTPELAAHYGVPYPFDSEWQLVQQATTERAGLLTLGSFLTRFGSPPARGTQLSEALSCLTIPRPPFTDSIWDDADVPPAKQVVTEKYGTEPICEACHQYYVGYAIALDRYDALGRYRETLNGVAIDTSYYLATSSAESGTPSRLDFANPQELGQALSAEPQVRTCLVQKLNEFLGGSALSDTELSCVLSEFDTQQASFWSLLAVLSPHFLGN